MGDEAGSGARARPGGAGAPVDSLWTSAGLVFFGNLAARVLGLIFPLLVAHAASRDDFALVSFFISTGFFAGELVLTGYPTAMTRQVAVARGEGAGRWLFAATLAGAPLLVLSAVLGELLAAGADAPPLLTTLVVCGLTVDAYYFAALRGLQQFPVLVAYRIAANAAQLVLLSAAAIMGIVSVPLVVGIYATVYLLPILAIEAWRGPVTALGRGAGTWTVADLGVLTRFAIPALVSGVAYGGLIGFDVFFVRVFAPAELADYAAARTLAMPMLMLSYAISVVLLPRVAAERNGLAQRQLLLRAQAMAVVMGLALSAVYIGAAPLLIELLLPGSYRDAIGPLQVLAPALLPLSLYSILSQWHFARGRPLAPALSLATGAGAAIVAHVFLTSAIGAVGAAFAIGIGAVTALALLLAFTLFSSRVPGGAPS